MDLSEFEELVLETICNDYEEIGQISIDLAQWGAAAGHAQIGRALRRLVELGLAKRYGPEERKLVEVANEVDWEELEWFYFYVTTEGKKRAAARE